MKGQVERFAADNSLDLLFGQIKKIFGMTEFSRSKDFILIEFRFYSATNAPRNNSYWYCAKRPLSAPDRAFRLNDTNRFCVRDCMRPEAVRRLFRQRRLPGRLKINQFPDCSNHIATKRPKKKSCDNKFLPAPNSEYSPATPPRRCKSNHNSSRSRHRKRCPKPPDCRRLPCLDTAFRRIESGASRLPNRVRSNNKYKDEAKPRRPDCARRCRMTETALRNRGFCGQIGRVNGFGLNPKMSRNW